MAFIFYKYRTIKDKLKFYLLLFLLAELLECIRLSCKLDINIEFISLCLALTHPQGEGEPFGVKGYYQSKVLMALSS